MSKEEFPDGKIRFEIEELGPIRDSIIDFKPFLLFSGESNTGKSYTAMAVYYLLYMLNEKDIMEKSTLNLFDIKKIEKDLKPGQNIELELSEKLITDLEKLYNNNIQRFLAYMLGYEDFSCKAKLKMRIPRYSESKAFITYQQKKNEPPDIEFKLDSPIYNWGTTLVNRSKSDLRDDLIYFVHGICKRLIFGKDYRNFFLPPARGAFSGLTLSMWEKFSGIGMYKEFLRGIDSVKFDDFGFRETIQKQKKLLKPLFNRLLDGDIKVERDEEIYTIASTGKKIPLNAASSSVKEISPLHRLLKRVPIDKLSICIEEPEAHLHPKLQRGIAQLLSYIVNRGGSVQATTHSDFFINQVNNLLKLHFIKNKDKDRYKKALNETGIGEDFILNPEAMGVYYFEKTKKGTAQAKKLAVSEKGFPLESFANTYEKSTNETWYLREALTYEE